MAKDKKVNETTSVPKPSVLSDTLSNMEEYSFNEINSSTKD